LLAPPPFPGSSFIDFERHHDVYMASYRWALEKIEELLAANNPAVAAILAAGTTHDA
jgi:hypothetical protein